MIFNNKYDLISRTTVVNMPIIIIKNKTNGYKDIIIKVEGGFIYKHRTYLKGLSTTVTISESSIKDAVLL